MSAFLRRMVVVAALLLACLTPVGIALAQTMPSPSVSATPSSSSAPTPTPEVQASVTPPTPSTPPAPAPSVAAATSTALSPEAVAPTRSRDRPARSPIPTFLSAPSASPSSIATQELLPAAGGEVAELRGEPDGLADPGPSATTVATAASAAPTGLEGLVVTGFGVAALLGFAGIAGLFFTRERR
jgi:hypothetical protein